MKGSGRLNARVVVEFLLLLCVFCLCKPRLTGNFKLLGIFASCVPGMVQSEEGLNARLSE